jgi:putative tryptophan/tyrosine transport system substrate-binding protein
MTMSFSRRMFLAAGFVACGFPAHRPSHAQRLRVRRVGLVFSSPPQTDLDGRGAGRLNLDRIEAELRQLGWVPGESIQLVARSAESRYERFPAIVDELLHSRVEVLVVFGPEAAKIARERAGSVPVVWPVAFNRPPGPPSGNVTGMVVANPVLKRLEILKAIAPRSSRVAMFARVAPGEKPPELTAPLVAAARTLGLEPFAIYFEAAEELDGQFAKLRAARADAVYMSTFPVLTWNADVRRAVVDLAARHRLPMVCEDPDLVAEGALIGFGHDDAEIFRRTAQFIDRILKGTRPADLPLEQPMAYRLNINRRTAGSLGLTIWPALLLQADTVFD